MLEFSNNTTWPIVPAAPELNPAVTCSCDMVQFGVVGLVVVVLDAGGVDDDVVVDGAAVGVPLLHAAKSSVRATSAVMTPTRVR